MNKTESYCKLDVEDIEAAVSLYFNQTIKISEMDVRMFDSLLVDGNRNSSSFFYITVPKLTDNTPPDIIVNDLVDSGTLFDKQNWPDFTLNKTEVFIDEQYIFNFNTDLFHSYKRSTELSLNRFLRKREC